jgi:hypothetical protein
MRFNIGDNVKIDTENRVFKVSGFTGKGSKVIPEGWLIDQDGFSVNPKFCKPYSGAKSVLTL